MKQNGWTIATKRPLSPTDAEAISYDMSFVAKQEPMSDMHGTYMEAALSSPALREMRETCYSTYDSRLIWPVTDRLVRHDTKGQRLIFCGFMILLPSPAD